MNGQAAPGKSRTWLDAVVEPSQKSIDHAQALLEGFSLPASEAKTLVALLRLGAGTTIQLVPLTGIGKTNLYRNLESLRERKLVEKTSGRATVWQPAEMKEIIWRLGHLEEEKFRAAKRALGELEVALKDVPEPAAEARAVVAVTDQVTVAFRYAEAVASAAEELLVFNRGPFVGEVGTDPAVLAALGRGVRARAVCVSDEVYGPGMDQVLGCALAYVAAGVKTRVVDELPVSMALIDRRLALVSFPGRDPGELPYVSSVAVDHPAFGEVLARVFQQCWEEGVALEASAPQLRVTQRTGRRRARPHPGDDGA